ncbi:MAG: hypothetical protein JJ974_07885 [Phycisphaerales bacterium]|nr:hypothetical protein [Phycisphaerales bacterium]
MSSHQSNRTNAWEWSLKHSPLMHSVRWILNRGQPHLRTRELLQDSDLPAELAGLIDQTVRRTKLWRSERIEITHELIAHTEDALDSGRTPEQIVRSFGNPRKVAKLLRRATKRKRPLYWRTLRNIRRGVAAMILLIFISYVGLAARFYLGEPNIKENYAYAINALNEQYDEDQKAWPIYEEVRAAWDLHIADAQKRQSEYEREYNSTIENGDEAISAGIQMIPNIPTDHHDYEEVVGLFRSFKPQLDRVRDAAHRPTVGIDLSFFASDHDDEMIEPSAVAHENPPLINLLLPHLGTHRQLANMLYFETILAARDQNPALVYENLSAMLSMARHESHDGTIITDLVEIAILASTMNAMEEVLNEYPGTLSRAYLVKLTHELALCESVIDFSYQGEIMFFEDFLQRTYTDDGNGNGRMTPEGMDLLAEFVSFGDDEFGISKSPVRYATGPASLALAPDRRSVYTRYHSMMDLSKSVKDLGPEYLPLLEAKQTELERESNTIPGMRYSLIDMLIPALGAATERLFMSKMEYDATLTMLAIEVYKSDHGQPPESLSELIPSYLPSEPMDLFDPGSSMKYKTLDTGYMLYSVGSDADDDLGAPHESRYGYPDFSKRFPPSYSEGGELRLDDAGVPIPDEPRGREGDWILIDLQVDPKTKEPDRSLVPESIN